jgi:hypothetical protein
MANSMRALGKGLGIALYLSIISCGGGSFTPSGNVIPPTGSNVASVIVDAGPTLPGGGGPLGTYNVLFVTVTVCLPSAPSTCQVIDHVLVDTGSYGLRLLAPPLSLVFPLQQDVNGNSLAECAEFADGSSWGSVVLANMQIEGEAANNLPIQLIGDARLPNIPGDCPGPPENTVQNFGANGVIGIGPFSQDCPECSGPDGVIPGTYYACPQTGACSGVTVALTDQVVNPVVMFPADNNGEIIQLNSVANAGAVSVSGTLTFGVDTETNNVSGTQNVFNVDGFAEMTITFQGVALTDSFIDSGSNSNDFNTQSLTACAANGDFAGYYCPQNTVTGLAATLQGVDPMGNAIAGQTTGTQFSVGSAQVQLSTSNSALPALGATNSLPNSFDYGLPFFYGRRVAVVVNGAKTTVGTGPYIAF